MNSYQTLVAEYFDRDAGRYEADRYTSDFKDCHQFSYLARRDKVLQLLPREAVNALDIGCGPGIFLPTLLERSRRVCACDISPNMILKARERFASSEAEGRLTFKVGTIDELGCRAAEYDLALCVGVISYITDIAQFLDDLTQIITPGGVVLVQFSKRLSLKAFDENIVRPALRTVARGLFSRTEKSTPGFPLRRYGVGEFNSLCMKAGLAYERSLHFDFTWPFISRMAPRVNLALARRLEQSERWNNLFAPLAGDYLARYRKVGLA